MSIKQGRMEDRILAILSELLRREVSDPRLHNITFTEVKLDGELMYADVYVNALGDEGRQADVMEGLKRASSFLRREIGKRIRLRNTPALNFHWDTTLEHGERMSKLVEELNLPPLEAAPNTETDSDDDDDSDA
jgi:ribosome-binding factor A